jgi:plastocyanin
MRRKLISVLVVALGAMLVAGPAGGAATKRIKVGDDWYVRDDKGKNTVPTVSVKKGTKVTWVWTGRSPHNVFVKSGPTKFASKVQKKGSFSRTLSKTGTYVIYCQIHTQKQQSMKLKVTR